MTTPKSAEERAEALAAAPVAVSARRVRKTFRLPHQQYHTLKERVMHPFRARTYDLLHALNDVSFEVPRGQFLGIVGRNGSGKSTLLKCLAGIYDIDAGRIALDGRLSPFIELGVGFNPDLTARDNVRINAIMLGLTRAQAEERFDEIIAFAELEEFIDLKLKNYSSGMSVRLGFSIAIQVDADILLIDEVLAVGDARFQQKCYEEFERMRDEERTLLLVTHDMASVERLCDRAILLERGEIVDEGESAPISRAYNEMNLGGVAAPESSGPRQIEGTNEAEIREAWFENTHGERIQSLPQADSCRICIEIVANAELVDPVFALTLKNESHQTIFAASSHWEHGPTGRFRAGETATVRVEFQNWLAPGRYAVTPSITSAAGRRLDLRYDLASVMVHGTRVTGGVADLPHDFEVSRL